jgi:hypothetical protein
MTPAIERATGKRSAVTGTPSVLGFHDDDSNFWEGTPMDFEDGVDAEFDDDEYELGLDSALDEVLVPRGWLSL